MLRLVVHIGISLAFLVLYVWLVWPTSDQQEQVVNTLRSLSTGIGWTVLFLYPALLAVTHSARGWRWRYLLQSIGAKVAPMRLMAISSVGFMAILVLPARLGEFVRPALIHKRGEIRASEALGTIAVERVIDGLVLAVFLFLTFWANRGSPYEKPWMMIAAYGALSVFACALVFICASLRWPQTTVRFAVGITGMRLYAPRWANFVQEKLIEIIRGCAALKDTKNITMFLLWTIVYWTANGFSVWLLAQAFHLPLSVVGAGATMALVAVGIILPNPPLFAGQYQAFVIMALTLYMPNATAYGPGLAFAIVLHVAQVIWYVSIGLIAISSPYVSFRELRQSIGAKTTASLSAIQAKK